MLYFSDLLSQIIYFEIKIKILVKEPMKSLLYDTQTRQVTFTGVTGKINLPNPSRPVMQSENTQQFPFECILGIVKVDAFSRCLFFCSETESQGKYNESEVFRVVKVNYVALTDDTNCDLANSIVNLFESLRFYFTFDKQEEHFLWNGEMLKNFKEWAILPYTSAAVASVSPSLRSPFSSKVRESTNCKINYDFDQMLIGHLICGYFESHVVREDDKVYKLKIFSKISIKKIGTRLLSRGVDELGKVSFFVETKFITSCGDNKSEFTILRGSVPVFWSQCDPLKPHKIQFDQDIQKNRSAFKKHFKMLEAGYGKVVVVDLLGLKKYECQLSKIYRDLCEENDIDYINFDLNKHSEDIESIKCVFYKKISDFIKKLAIRESPIAEDKKEDLNDANRIEKLLTEGQKTSVASFINCNDSSDEEDFNWDDEEEEIVEDLDLESLTLQNRSEQVKDLKITFRVNCMDCLDRTNIGQYIISRYFCNLRFQSIKSMWVNNGNALSQMYTGSNSLKTELPSKGKLSMMGRVNDFVISANRMIQNKFVDQDKQMIIDLILGKKSN